MRLSRCVPYRLEHVHHVIADVASYPEFVPGVAAARILPHSDTNFMADLDVNILGKSHTYRSYVTLEPLCIKASATTFLGNLDVSWHLERNGTTTIVNFSLSTSIPGFDWLLPQEWPKRIMNAFEERCRHVA
jgi:ribosome-associated toxin RatA of RatAB toxin-antitoxin module